MMYSSPIFKLSAFPPVVCVGFCFLLLSIFGDDADSGVVISDAHQHIKQLSSEGTKESLEELQRVLQDEDFVNLLFDDNRRSGRFSVLNTVGAMLYTLGERQDENSYQLLTSFLENDHPRGIFKEIRYAELLDNLVKYRDLKGEELTKILEGELEMMVSKALGYEEDYPFLSDESTFYDYRSTAYISEDGDEIYGKPVVTNDSKSSLILSRLYLVGSEDAYRIIESYLTSWVGRENSSSMVLPFDRLKERRYDAPVIDIYEAIIRDPRYLKATRAEFVEHFFGNSISPYFPNVENPEEDYAQIGSANEQGLIRMLRVSNYALTLDFLPTETVDLVAAKHAEIIDRLVGMGYSQKKMNGIEVAEPALDQGVKGVVQSEPAAEEQPDEVYRPELSEKTPKQSSNWWLWLIGAVVVLGGAGLAIRRKN